MFERSVKFSERSVIHHSKRRPYVDDLHGGEILRLLPRQISTAFKEFKQ